MADTKQMTVELYCCPTPGCANFYGAPNLPDLTERLTGVSVDDAAEYIRAHGTRWKHSRAQCPDCRQRFPPIYVERVRITTTVTVPVAGPDAPTGQVVPTSTAA